MRGLSYADRRAWWIAAATVLVILVVTMAPARTRELSGSAICLICGERGVADAILNIVLFLPLGAALGFHRRSSRVTYLVAVLLSAGIEFVQVFIPGRDSSLGDVLFNALGAALGLLLVQSHLRWALPDRALATRLSLVATAVVMGGFLLTGYLLVPSYPESVYYGQWTPDLGYLEWYRGEVLHAALGPLPIPEGRLSDVDSVRTLLRSRAPLRVDAVAGPPVRSLAPLFNIYDDKEREVIVLGLDRDDLVFRQRTRAISWRLDQPDTRLLGGLRRLAAGDTLRIVLEPGTHGHCLSVNQLRECRLGFSLGTGWAFLLYPEAIPAWLKMLLNALWVASLAVPITFWSRTGLLTMACVIAVVAGLAFLPAVLGLAATPPLEFAGAAVGLLGGSLLGWWVRTARYKRSLWGTR